MEMPKPYAFESKEGTLIAPEDVDAYNQQYHNALNSADALYTATQMQALVNAYERELRQHTETPLAQYQRLRKALKIDSQDLMLSRAYQQTPVTEASIKIQKAFQQTIDALDEGITEINDAQTKKG